MKLKKDRVVNKLNLIPILDSVFIFIFFLLMSAQFIDLYEIGGDAPIIKKVTEVQNQKEQLNLVLEIGKEQILVRTGEKSIVLKTINRAPAGYDLEGLRKTLISLKMSNKEESQVVIRPSKEVVYSEVVSVMDIVREFIQVEGIGKTRLFNKIIFDTLGS